jgi:hypothetical protein
MGKEMRKKKKGDSVTLHPEFIFTQEPEGFRENASQSHPDPLLKTLHDSAFDSE